MAPLLHLQRRREFLRDVPPIPAAFGSDGKPPRGAVVQVDLENLSESARRQADASHGVEWSIRGDAAVSRMGPPLPVGNPQQPPVGERQKITRDPAAVWQQPASEPHLSRR